MTTLSNEVILSIDLGSAYTKLAIRTTWDGDSTMVGNVPIAPQESSFCIPSVVAHDSDRDRWLIGVDAASQVPGDGVKIYRNWKALLYEDNDNPWEVATEFFSTLRAKLRGIRRLGENVASVPVRICLPKASDAAKIEEVEQRVIATLAETGWTVASDRASVYEPEANALGIVTRGLNKTWIPPYFDFTPHRGRSVSFPRMLDPDLNNAFRQMRDTYGVLVVDIGAYTTDFGYVLFDSSYKIRTGSQASGDWDPPDLKQCSYKLGVHELDSSVYRGLGVRTQQAIRRLSTAEWEKHRLALYSGEEVALRDRDGVFTIGRGADREVISEALNAFARRVIETREEFCCSIGLKVPDAEIITGGGSMILQVRQKVMQHIRNRGTPRIHDLLDAEEPREALGDAPARRLEERAVQNRELVRGGSALGGCSVFFG